MTTNRGWFSPQWHYDNEPETHTALDLIFSNHFSRYEPKVFAPLRDLYADPDAWARKAILKVAGSGKFSSDRTIAEYAAEIWNTKPCPVD